MAHVSQIVISLSIVNFHEISHHVKMFVIRYCKFKLLVHHYTVKLWLNYSILLCFLIYIYTCFVSFCDYYVTTNVWHDILHFRFLTGNWLFLEWLGPYSILLLKPNSCSWYGRTKGSLEVIQYPPGYWCGLGAKPPEMCHNSRKCDWNSSKYTKMELEKNTEN